MSAPRYGLSPRLSMTDASNIPRLPDTTLVRSPRRSSIRKKATFKSYAAIHRASGSAAIETNATPPRRATVGARPRITLAAVPPASFDDSSVDDERIADMMAHTHGYYNPSTPGDETDGGGGGGAHFQALIAHKDKTIQDLLQACTKYRVDCETFCNKALDWKKKHDAVAKQVLQLQADNFVLQGQRRPAPTLAWDDLHTPVLIFTPPATTEATTNARPSSRPPSPPRLADPLPGQLDDDITALTRVHERQVDALKFEVSRLQVALRDHEADGTALTTLHDEYAAYKALSEAKFEQCEAEVGRFKAQMALVAQDYADQLAERTARTTIDMCAHVAREKQRQAMWDADRVALDDLREKVQHLESQAAAAKARLVAAATETSALKDDVARRVHEHAKARRDHTTLVAQHLRLLAKSSQRKLTTQRLAKRMLLLAAQVTDLGTSHGELNRAEYLKAMPEKARKEVDEAANTEGQPPIDEEDCKDEDIGSTVDADESSKRIETLQNALVRRKQREQSLLRTVRDLRRVMLDLQRTAKEYAIFKTETTHELQRQENQVQLYATAYLESNSPTHRATLAMDCAPNDDSHRVDDVKLDEVVYM
ncbi:Aste57867_1570 [Aphanomyces stellatus]|uniref:Aste57867_1570 protein n=1 Tax=Aphanomyces stellatus TaxID=120398 RepID=A0A485K6K6_9STRA|nr:hypothetical protein As57867_001569 [Aphanomyces stellatus]VFT78783.1 Aste57867_1570 [Aphanomyces stellatus]